MFNRSCKIWLFIVLLFASAACGATATPTATPLPAAPTPLPKASAPTQSPPTIAPAPQPTLAAYPAPASASAFPLTLTDGAERKVTISKPAQKIVSLSPSTTEILFALGLGSKVVAVDMFSDYPADAKKLPNVGGSSGQFNFEQIVTLAPDLIISAGIIAPDSVKKLEELKLTIVVIGSKQTTMDSIMGDIALVGKATGADAQAKQITDAMQKKLEALKAKAATAKAKPKVYWELDGTDPSKPFSVGPGNFINDLIALSNGENIFGQVTSPFPKVSAEQIVNANPGIIILSDFAYGVTPEMVKARAGWNVIAAVKNDKVFPIDDNLVSRPGPRVVDGFEAALKLIQPELFK